MNKYLRKKLEIQRRIKIAIMKKKRMRKGKAKMFYKQKSINASIKHIIEKININKKKVKEKIESQLTIAYIIPYKKSDIYRYRNLLYIINYVLKNYNYLNIYITEEDVKPTLPNNKLLKELIDLKIIRYNFLYRKMRSINRGKIFNETIKNFLDNEELLIMGDGDLPLLYLDDIIKFYNNNNKKYQFISPYTSLIKTNNNQVNNMIFGKNNKFVNSQKSTLYTFSGGILIANREEFIKLGGWFDFNYYGNEDRAMDVILEKLRPGKFIKLNYNYIHLWHPKSNTQDDLKKITENCNFLINIFGCMLNKDIIEGKNLHDKCKHKESKDWIDLYNKKSIFK